MKSVGLSPVKALRGHGLEPALQARPPLRAAHYPSVLGGAKRRREWPLPFPEGTPAFSEAHPVPSALILLAHRGCFYFLNHWPQGTLLGWAQCVFL